MSRKEENLFITDFEGDKCWYYNNRLHREDGPAIETSYGGKHWFKNGERHREDGPAIEDPAIEDPTGQVSWWLNDMNYTEEEWTIEMRKIKLEKMGI